MEQTKTREHCCICNVDIQRIPRGDKFIIDGVKLISKKYGTLWFCPTHNKGGFMKLLASFRKSQVQDGFGNTVTKISAKDIKGLGVFYPKDRIYVHNKEGCRIATYEVM